MILSPVLLCLLTVGAVCMAVLMWLLLFRQSEVAWQLQCQRYSHLSQNSVVKSDSSSFFTSLGSLYPVSEKETERLKQMLEHAGISGSSVLLTVLGTKLFLGLISVVLGLIWQAVEGELMGAYTVMVVLIGYVLGSNLPEYWLRRQATQAQQKQQQAVPDAIDLMVISVEAGLSLERALEKVGLYLLDVEPMLARQMLRTYAEIQVRGEPAQCLKKLAWRTGLRELERLANTLAMAERYGSPLAETMRTISNDARQSRKMSLQEQAGKLPGRITLIQMALIMLPLMVLIVAPTMNLLLESLK
ncbi:MULTISPECIES: type II secretion system F family protein [Vibrio]|uniref:type II secretion system F family protein n=1 Tax=Vibrio TaxID=662 RepID=UPI000C9E958A|nr:type II secretion system F family protein [Vibrio diazotrophicus]PNH95228.1 pilus assembly protein TadC [Vibrio diazotrophicus]